MPCASCTRVLLFCLGHCGRRYISHGRAPTCSRPWYSGVASRLSSRGFSAAEKPALGHSLASSARSTAARRGSLASACFKGQGRQGQEPFAAAWAVFAASPSLHVCPDNTLACCSSSLSMPFAALPLSSSSDSDSLHPASTGRRPSRRNTRHCGAIDIRTVTHLRLPPLSACAGASTSALRLFAVMLGRHGCLHALHSGAASHHRRRCTTYQQQAQATSELTSMTVRWSVGAARFRVCGGQA